MDLTPTSASIPADLRSRLVAIRARWFVGGALGLVVGCGTSGENRAEKLPDGVAKPAPPRQANALPGTGAAENITRLREPIIISGDGNLIGSRAETPPEGAGAAGDITLNFVDTDVREVMRAVLGDVLHLNYAVD